MLKNHHRIVGLVLMLVLAMGIGMGLTEAGSLQAPGHSGPGPLAAPGPQADGATSTPATDNIQSTGVTLASRMRADQMTAMEKYLATMQSGQTGLVNAPATMANPDDGRLAKEEHAKPSTGTLTTTSTTSGAGTNCIGLEPSWQPYVLVALALIYCVIARTMISFPGNWTMTVAEIERILNRIFG